MKIIILPGFSPHNKDWGEEIKQKLDLGHKIILHQWQHWLTGNSDDFVIENELRAVLEEINKGEVDLIAKSVGTYMAMRVLKTIPSQILKIILCGIPLPPKDMEETEKSEFQALNLIGSDKVLCFQNVADPLANFRKVNELIENINPEIKVVVKERNDHEYPYFDDFRKFLSS
jgi:pimeloyl-ACP methyl ester carboxylesterase